MENEERQEKNAVAFGGSPPVNKVTSEEEEIPYEDIPLPSNGVIYESGTSLHKRESLPVKVMTAEEENILTNPAYMKRGTVLEELVSSCVLDKTVNHADLIAGDHNALLVGLRIIGYGSEYPGRVECSSCGEIYEHTFRLDELELKRLKISPVEVGKNLFEYTLPVSKEKVIFKFLTVKDQDDISTAKERMRKILGKSRKEENVTDKLRYSIVKIGNIENKIQLEKKIRRMRAMDSSALRRYMQDNEPGIDMKQSVECPECTHVEEVVMPLGIDFLYPNATE